MQKITHIWANRLALILLGLGTCSQTLLAQKPPAPTTTTPPAPNTGNTNRGTMGNNTPNLGNGNTLNYPSNDSQMNRTIFLSGKVMFEDGAPPSIDVRIERVCGGSPRLEAHTDSKGRFSFQLGQGSNLNMDASDMNSSGGFGPSNGGFSNGRMNGNSSISASALWNCELRASYPGYRSDVVQLGGRRSLDNPDVGIIILHRLANVKGSTISLTTALAPKAAVKHFEKGEQLAAKGKLEDSEKHLLQATDLYPKFASAWFLLGQVQQRQNKPDDARKDYLAAIQADAKYVSPYNQLALLAAQEGKWEDAAAYSKQAIDLNPVEFPTAFWYNAIANYNLKKPAEAVKSAQTLVKMDAQHRIPEAESLLAQLAMDSRDYTEAATHLRAYLALAPNAKNAEALKRQLSQIDEASAATKK
ncbi:MAG TPA: tetratricopeptide repeat protein [Bryobacteraceae bacterium]|nr:tetratricopeptide repeat protein [Bryobacteraceae bacterium]